MKRKTFIKSAAAGLGTLSVLPLLKACKPETTEVKTEVKPAPKANLKPKVVTTTEGHQLNVLGDNQNIKLTGKDTDGQYTLIEQFNDPGVGIPPHVHENEDEVFQVLEGQVAMQIGDQATTLGPGDLIFCPRGIPHSWKVVGEVKAKAMLSIFPAGLENMFEELAALPAGPPDMKKVVDICGKYNLKFV